MGAGGILAWGDQMKWCDKIQVRGLVAIDTIMTKRITGSSLGTAAIILLAAPLLPNLTP